MFSPNQINCLKALKVSPVRKNESLTASLQSDDRLLTSQAKVQKNNDDEPSEHIEQTKYLDWNLAPKKLIEDLTTIFPNLAVAGSELKLTPNLIWLSSEHESNVHYENGYLITPNFNELSKPIKMSIWKIIKPLSEQ